MIINRRMMCNNSKVHMWFRINWVGEKTFDLSSRFFSLFTTYQKNTQNKIKKEKSLCCIETKYL